MFTVFTLLVVFQLKHFIADYLLQGKYMLGKFKDDWGFFLPLFAHSVIHGAFTLVICLFVRPNLWWFALVDVVTHFIMDRVKAGNKYLGRFKALSANEMKVINQNTSEGVRLVRRNTYFWYALGIDQMFHHFVHYVIIWALVMEG